MVAQRLRIAPTWRPSEGAAHLLVLCQLMKCVDAGLPATPAIRVVTRNSSEGERLSIPLLKWMGFSPHIDKHISTKAIIESALLVAIDAGLIT